MENPELNELRKQRDELRRKTAQMRKDWIRENPDKIRKIRKRQTFFEKLTEKHQAGEREVSESASGKLCVSKRVQAMITIIAIIVLAFFVLDYIGRSQREFERVKKYQELVKNYEELIVTDKYLLYNCFDLVITEPTDENLSQNAEEANMLMKKKDEAIRIINQIREDLGLFKHPLL